MVNITDEKLLDWSEYKNSLEIIKKLSINQFLAIYDKFKRRDNDSFKWGDELEFTLIKFDHEAKKVYLLLKAEEFFSRLNEIDKRQVDFHIEYTKYQIETIPNEPWDQSLSSFKKMQRNLEERREIIQNFLKKDEHVVSLATFPRIGCLNFTWPNSDTKDEYYEESKFKSVFFSSNIIYNNDFCRKYTKNKNLRKGRKVEIYVPIYVDKNTPQPFVEDLSQFDMQHKSKPNQIYMDHDGFGFGCTCLQVTIQAKCMDEACNLYDQLTALSPLFIALSASSPIWRGYLANIDTRWSSLQQSSDDRTDTEIAKNLKTRWDVTECYISQKGQKFNNQSMLKDVNVFEKLIENVLLTGVDIGIANHYANMFLRDPYYVFEKSKRNDNDSVINDAKEFELFQSLNFKMVRFKTPPMNQTSEIGWRIEFRPLDLQFTDYENTAFSTLIVLITKTILKFNLDFLIKIEELEKNMKTSEKVNACLKEKFYFTFNSEQSTLMTLNEIMNGSSQFKGLILYIKEYLDIDDSLTAEEKKDCLNYLKLIEMRANGKKMTPASWIRKFVKEHSDYLNDSIVNEKINYDLLVNIVKFSNGMQCEDLF